MGTAFNKGEAPLPPKHSAGQQILMRGTSCNLRYSDHLRKMYFKGPTVRVCVRVCVYVHDRLMHYCFRGCWLNSFQDCTGFGSISDAQMSFLGALLIYGWMDQCSTWKKMPEMLVFHHVRLPTWGYFQRSWFPLPTSFLSTCSLLPPTSDLSFRNHLAAPHEC